MRYYGSTGKPITREEAIASLPTGSRVRVEGTRKNMDVQLIDGFYQAGCEKCNAKCKMSKPESGLHWVEDHIKKEHS